MSLETSGDINDTTNIFMRVICELGHKHFKQKDHERKSKLFHETLKILSKKRQAIDATALVHQEFDKEVNKFINKEKTNTTSAHIMPILSRKSLLIMEGPKFLQYSSSLKTVASLKIYSLWHRSLNKKFLKVERFYTDLHAQKRSDQRRRYPRVKLLLYKIRISFLTLLWVRLSNTRTAKNHKAPVKDGVTTELIKADRTNLWRSQPTF